MPFEIDIDKLPAKLIYDLLIALFTGVVIGLFVDTLIKRREEERWRPIRNSLYATLLRPIDELLYGVLTSAAYDVKTKWFHFGSALASASHNLKMPNWQKSVRDGIAADLKTQFLAFEQREQAESLTPSDREQILGKTYKIGALSEFKTSLDALIQIYAVALEPGLMSRLVELYDSVSQYIGTQPEKSPSKIDMGTNADILESIIRMAWGIREWLAERAEITDRA